VDTPVCTAISQFLVTPHHGTGIYNTCPANAGGHEVNVQKSYTVKITRTTGPAYAVLHRIKWVGNDGTFESPGFVALPLNQTVSVTVKAKAKSAGSHSAVMQVDDLTTLGHDFEIMNAIKVSTALAGPGYQFSTTGSVPRNGYKSYFITVPPGTPALQVNLSGIADGSQTRWIAISPWGIPAESTSSLNCYTNRPIGGGCNPTSRFYANPLPGIWEFEVESRRTSPLLDNPFTLTATLQGVTVSPATVELASVPAGVPQPLSWNLTNNFGPVTVSGNGGPLGSAVRSTPTIAHHETHAFQVTVPAGATRLTVTIGSPSDPAADLDLFVRRGGVLVGQAADGDSEESVTINNPPPGVYDIEVDGFDVPAGTTTYNYLDVFFSATLGSLDVDATPVALGSGGTGTINGSVTALVAPAVGRQLFGDMTVVTTQGAVVGRGSVAIGAVTP
jgi:Bacterial pre-peptidase C-terminal domain